MASDHPFQLLFETLGRVPAAHADSVNRQAHEILSDILSVPVERRGRCILLRAPRAGHGKTHLLSRIQHELGASCEFIPLHASFGCKIDAGSVTDDTLRRLVRQLPAAGGLTVLDLVTRRLFSSALQPLVGSGEVPCQDRDGALTALRARPIETFDFHHPNAVTAHWARENFEVLGQRLSMELAQRADLPVSDVAFWVDALFRFASAPLENTSRVRALGEAVHSGTGVQMERLEALLGLLTLLMRVVLVADDLEGFSADESAALKLAAFLGSLRQSVERLDVILSLNQDIWQSAFLPRLSGGLADRLSEVVVELEPLKESEMADLLDSRVPGLGSRVLERIDVNSAGTHARGLIRAAGVAWLKATAMDSAPPAAVVPEVAPEPIAEPIPKAVPAPVPVETPKADSSPSESAGVEPEPVIEGAPEIEIPPTDGAAPVIEGVPAVSAARVAEVSRIFEPAPVFAAEPVFEKSAPETEHPAFTFSPAPTSEHSEESVSWPIPEFTPAPLVDIHAESETYQSPFQIEPQTPAGEPPVATFAPQDWQPAPTSTADPLPPAQWPPQVPAAEIASEPRPFHPSVDSPFQVAEAAQLSPELLSAAGWHEPVQVATEPPKLESPYQATPEPWSPAPPLAETPPQISAEPPSVGFVPSDWKEPAMQEPAHDALEQPRLNSSFQNVTPQQVPPESPTSGFNSSNWKETGPYAAPQETVQIPAEPQQTDSPPQWTPAPPSAVSPFQNSPEPWSPEPPSRPAYHYEPAVPSQTDPAPTCSPPPPPVEVPPPPTTTDTDRVDDLLRQFRERYGRGSL